MNKWIDLFLIIVLMLFGFFAVKALLQSGYFTSHDGWHQVVRAYYFDKSVRGGIFPPNYVSYLFNGFGYPLFIFNYHLPWIISEPFILAGLSIFEAIKGTYIITYLISGLTMFLFLRQQFKPLSSFIGSFLYLWVPYRFVNIYVRGSIGEATIFIFIPLIFLALEKLKLKYSFKNISLAAFAITGLLLSHAIVSLLVLLMIGIYLIIQTFFLKNRLNFFRGVFWVIILSVLLSAFYLVPAVSLKKYTQFDQRFNTIYDGHFASIKEMIYSKWGYGFSLPRTPDSMSFQAGLTGWLVFIFCIPILIFRTIRRKNIPHQSLICGILSVFIISIFLITPASKFVWDFLSRILFTIDFPWRLLTMVVFSSAIIGCFLIDILPKKTSVAVSLLILSVAVYTNRNHLRVNQYTDIPLNIYLNSELTTNTYDEYVPVWVNNPNFFKDKPRAEEIQADQQITVTNIKKKTNSLSFNYYCLNSCPLTVNLFYFPGWQAFIDKVKVTIDHNNDGLITFKALPGNHQVLIRYNGTFIYRLSKYVSLLTFIIAVLLYFSKFGLRLFPDK